MLLDKSIAVVVPCYNEEKQIIKVLEGIPDYVDRVVVVNDKSTDNTAIAVSDYIKKYSGNVPTIKNFNENLVRTKFNNAEFVAEEMMKKALDNMLPYEIANKNPENSRIILINHLVNGSVGAAISSGYKWCLQNGIYCTAVMAGDGQMDPDDLESICMPVVTGEVDYVKANRLSYKYASEVIPPIRFIGNSVLSLLTKIASGYWKVSDTQSGYTAISLKALKAIKINELYKTYGFPNDVLVKLNIGYFKVKEVLTKPVYNVGEKSKMKEFRVIPKISWLLFKSFWKRLYTKYLIKDFHPLFLLYHLGIILLLINIVFAVRIVSTFIFHTYLSDKSTMAFIFLTIASFQSMFFAMWMDMLDNERLFK